MRRAFDVAWFLHTSPAEVLALPLADFLVWEAHAYRIARAQAGREEP